MVTKVRFLRAVMFLAALLLPGIVAPMYADLFFQFDENGHGFISVDGGPLTSNPGSLVADPGRGGAASLTYFLPSADFNNGDVLVRGVGELGGQFSDVLRFTDAAGRLFTDNTHPGDADRIIFYSEQYVNDPPPPIGDLADTGPPLNVCLVSQPGICNNLAGVDEVGTEGVNSFTYKTPDGKNVYVGIYVGFSDVPEPGSLILLGSVCSAFALGGWRRRQQA